MSKTVGGGRKAACNLRILSKILAGTALTALALPGGAAAQAVQEDEGVVDEVIDDEFVNATDEEVIVVTGIRSSLQSALNEKRAAPSLVEVIQAEDIGKLPDQNLAEVLENIPGIQITRTAGVGSGVQIRGSNDNRTAINGVTTLGSGTGRGGINFEDVNAAIIASVEVTKAPTAETIEGSVGGTVDLRTIRPLDLRETLISFRAQGEYSELSDTISPRFSGSFGKVWELGGGELGIVMAGSYTEQEATSFRPRVDRDNGVPAGGAVTSTGAPGPDFPFLGIQFLNQELENFEYETINFAGSLEMSPTPGLKFYFDTFINDQERRQDSSRVQGSGVSSVIDVNVPDQFETVNFGSLDGTALGSIEAALVGVIEPNLAEDDDDPNLRFSSDTGARITDSQIYRVGTEWETGKLWVRVEGSITKADTVNPNLSTTLNFINPNAPLDGLDVDGNPTSSTSNDNSVPFRYDLRDGLAFGINFDSPFAPTVEQLLDPNNVVLDAVNVSRDTTENKEDAARIDLSYDASDFATFLTSIDVGYRYSKRSSTFTDIGTSRGFGRLFDSPNGALFSQLLVPGPNNFGDGDGRDLFFGNFLVIDPDKAFSDPDGTLDIIQAAFLQTPNMVVISDPSPDPDAFFSIDEKTHAAYAQLNFELGAVRGNAGVRYVDTSINSLGNTVINGNVTEVVTSGGYDLWLPRFNVAADITQDLVLRASFGKDVNRPDFNQLSTSVSFGTSPNAAVAIGNPDLKPETVTSYDASLSWYFDTNAVLSVGVFHKDRTDLFVQQLEEPFEDANGFRDITPPCEGGGIFNPIADQNVFVPGVPENGICVPIVTFINDTANTTQTGVEVAFQYDLARFEDTLGFASGFGILANYTYQEFGGGEATNGASNRGQSIFELINPGIGDVEAVQGLLDFSNHAYNVTLYYEKYGLSARARYTWRDAYRTTDTAGGASLNSTLGFPTVNAARGQLNASINYDVTDFLSVGVEGVNLTKSRVDQYCVNDGALLCFQGLPDRRITFGATLKL